MPILKQHARNRMNDRSGYTVSGDEKLVYGHCRQVVLGNWYVASICALRHFGRPIRRLSEMDGFTLVNGNKFEFSPFNQCTNLSVARARNPENSINRSLTNRNIGFFQGHRHRIQTIGSQAVVFGQKPECAKLATCDRRQGDAAASQVFNRLDLRFRTHDQLEKFGIKNGDKQGVLSNDSVCPQYCKVNLVIG